MPLQAALSMGWLGDFPRARGMTIALYMSNFAGGGVERMNMGLIRAFTQEGAKVSVVVQSDAGVLRGLTPDGVEVVTFGTRRTALDLLPLARYLRRRKPDILLGSLNHNNIIAALAKALGLSRTQLVIVQHNALSSQASGEAGWKYRIIPLCYRLMSPLTAGFLAVSHGVADDLAAATGIPRGRIKVIYNPVIGPEFARMLAAPAHHPWLRDPAVPVFVSAGRLVPQKDHETLLRAFALYHEQAAGRLIILGTGPLRESLVKLAADLGISEVVEFTGFVENPLSYIRGAAAFILSSRYEGFGNALVEALGCGTPVISTNCPFGPSEILGNGAFGRLVPVGNAEALAEAMSPCLREVWPPETLRARAAVFSVEASAAAYLDFFKNLLGRD